MYRYRSRAYEVIYKARQILESRKPWLLFNAHLICCKNDIMARVVLVGRNPTGTQVTTVYSQADQKSISDHLIPMNMIKVSEISKMFDVSFNSRT